MAAQVSRLGIDVHARHLDAELAEYLEILIASKGSVEARAEALAG